MHKLSGPELPPISGNLPKQLIIFLHGLGDSGFGLFGLTSFFTSQFPDAQFLSPNAPFKHPLLENGYQWFGLDRWDEDYIYNGIKTASPILENFIVSNMNRFSIDYKDVLLVGFSQGAMMSLHLAPRLREKIAGVVALSGSLISPQTLKDEIKTRPEILLAHGDNDEVVDYNEMGKAEKVLSDLNFNVRSVTEYGVAHNIGQRAIDEMLLFAKKILF